MDALLLALRCILAAVFLVAAFGKFRDLAGSRRALAEFGVPEPLARVGGLALPVAELGVGVALLIQPSARWGSAVALVLLASFIGGIARVMSQGRAPDCHCFGQIHSEPAGASTLVRNALLAAAALFVLVVGPGPTVDGALGSLDGTQAALVSTSIASALLAVAVAQLWAEKRRLERDLGRATAATAPPGLSRGTPAPTFELAAIGGTPGAPTEFLATGRPAVLVFLSTSCGPCIGMLSKLSGWQQSLAGDLALPAIFSGETKDVERLGREHGLLTVLAQEGEEAFSAYRLRATPSAVLVGADGIVKASPAEGEDAIEALIRSAVADSPAGGIIVRAG